jgi:hypothetical protein
MASVSGCYVYDATTGPSFPMTRRWRTVWWDLPPVRRLALEIALRERVRTRFDEARAAELAARWSEEEELARIVDEL